MHPHFRYTHSTHHHQMRQQSSQMLAHIYQTTQRHIPENCDLQWTVFYYYYWYSALGPVSAETRVQSGDWYGSGTLHPGQVLRISLPLLPPTFYMFPLFTTRCLHVRHDVRDPSGGSGNCGHEFCAVILPKWWLPRHLGIFYMPQIYDMGPMALLTLRRKACWGFFRP